jgi:hypothetical protein
VFTLAHRGDASAIQLAPVRALRGAAFNGHPFLGLIGNAPGNTLFGKARGGAMGFC